MRISNTRWQRLRVFGSKRSGHLEKWLSGIGGLLAILGVMLISQRQLGLSGSAGLVASMGASAVLLFAVPHGQLSQPWPVLGGHLISAFVGVVCVKMIPSPLLAAPLSVALAIVAMYYLRCIHPPGGATALAAVTGNEVVHGLGFNYILTPVLLNVLVILGVAFVFNLPFKWRRYPSLLSHPSQSDWTPGQSHVSPNSPWPAEGANIAPNSLHYSCVRARSRYRGQDHEQSE